VVHLDIVEPEPFGDLGDTKRVTRHTHKLFLHVVRWIVVLIRQFRPELAPDQKLGAPNGVSD
jgi:hypothetical protein